VAHAFDYHLLRLYRSECLSVLQCFTIIVLNYFVFHYIFCQLCHAKSINIIIIILLSFEIKGLGSL